MSIVIIMARTYVECYQKFKKQMRRSELSQMMQRKRTQLLVQISRQDLFDESQNILKASNVTSLTAILSNCKNILTHPFPLPHLIIDQQELLPIESHISLFRQILLQKSQQNMVTNLIEVILEIVNKYTCLQIHNQVEYQAQFYKIINMVADDLCKESRQKLIVWFRTNDSMGLIYKLISSIDGVNCRSYPNVYNIIAQALASKQQIYQNQAVILLAKITQYSQRTDLFYIYQDYFTIQQSIVNIMSQRLARGHHDLTCFWTAILHLFANFDEAIIGYARTGIIGVCGQMIATKNELNIFGALQILNKLCQVRDNNMIGVLLYNPQTDLFQVWIASCIDLALFKHSNIQIRKSFVILLRDVMRRMMLAQLNSFRNKFAQAGYDFLQCLQELLSFQDCSIQLLAIHCVDTLLLRERGTEAQHYEKILYSLQQRNIIQRINLLNTHQSCQIRQACGDLLDTIDYIKRTYRISQI